MLKYSNSEKIILEKRTEELSKKINDVLVEDKNEYILFLLSDNAVYGLEINFVNEIYEYIKPVFVPSLPNFFKGIINIRGEILPVVDMNLFLGKSQTIISDETKILRTKINKNEMGFIVNDVININSISKKEIFSINSSNIYIEGITDKMNNIIDAKLLLNDKRLFIDQT